MNWDVWAEGYGSHEGRRPARYLGSAEADTFAQACAALCSDATWQKRNGNFDPARLTVWGCRLFDNEAEARASFG